MKKVKGGQVRTGWFLSFRAALAEVPGHAGCGAL
jgi:hypothetical protein